MRLEGDIHTPKAVLMSASILGLCVSEGKVKLKRKCTHEKCGFVHRHNRKPCLHIAYCKSEGGRGCCITKSGRARHFKGDRYALKPSLVPALVRKCQLHREQCISYWCTVNYGERPKYMPGMRVPCKHVISSERYKIIVDRDAADPSFTEVGLAVEVRIAVPSYILRDVSRVIIVGQEGSVEKWWSIHTGHNYRKPSQQKTKYLRRDSGGGYLSGLAFNDIEGLKAVIEEATK